MKGYMVRSLLGQTATLVFLALCVGCQGNIPNQSIAPAGKVEQGIDPETGKVFFALDRSVVDDRGFKFDPDRSFQLAFGRGSGSDGFETIEVDNDLKAELFRQTNVGWESCVFELTLAEWGAVSDSIVVNGIYSLDRAYYADVCDGTQWKLAITQGNKTKTVYCNNFFPQALRRFAEDVDKVFDVDDALLEWESVPASLVRQRNDRLFNSLRN